MKSVWAIEPKTTPVIHHPLYQLLVAHQTSSLRAVARKQHARYCGAEAFDSITNGITVDETVRLTHYDPRWHQEFQQTRSSVLQACEGRVSTIDHVGSTAISGMIARPIIDLVATVSDPADLEDASACIQGLNYRLANTPDWAGDCQLLIKPRSGEPTHQLFLAIEGSTTIEQMVAITRFILQNNETQVRFESAKVSQWKAREGNPDAYANSKAIFFAHVLDQLNA